MKKLTKDPLGTRSLDVDEVRLVSDLRIMHAKVDELYQIVTNLKRRHDESSVHKYADQGVLNEDIERVDDIYLWFVSLKEETRKQRLVGRKR
jgi:hypothetical protein